MTSNRISEQEDLAANLRVDYEQTNQQIRMLADIRFKLLALVPTLTAIATLLTGATVAHGTVLAVGILGFITVFAIAMYDLRNSQLYDACIGRARRLENQLHMLSFTANRSGGLYSERPRHTISLFEIAVWHDRALALIYGSTLGGWFYIITTSLLFLVSSAFQWSRLPLFNQYIGVIYVGCILIAALIACLFIWQFHQIEAFRSRSRTLTVNSVDMPATIKNRQPEIGYKFVSVELLLTNRRKHSLKYNISELKLQDDQDYFYMYSAAATEHSNLTETLQPGQPRRLLIVYTIPEWNAPAKLVYTPRPRLLKVQQTIDLTQHTGMNIVLVRHGDRDHNYPPEKDKDSPLTLEGTVKINRLKDRLTRLNLNPDIYFTSPHEHAIQTTKGLSDGGPKPVFLDTITPGGRTMTQDEVTSEHIFEAIIDEAKQKEVELSKQTTIVIVGHKPRLDWILKNLTGWPNWPSIEPAEAVWIRADSFSAFRRGKGVVQVWISGDKGSDGSVGERGFAESRREDSREVE